MMERKNEMLENSKIEQMIITVRGKQVILDRELAKLYEVEISQMNRQVKRNIERFPEDFMFQLCAEEWASLKCHFGISNSQGGDRRLPNVFTEQGVSIKDLGKKWFGFTLMENTDAEELLVKL